MRIVKKWSFYKSVLFIAVPIAMQNLITLLTGLVDTLMLGQADETGVLLSASSLANQPFFILQMFCFGVAGAGAVLAAQYWGKKDVEAIRRVFSIVVKITFVVSAIVSACVIAFADPIMRIYSGNEQVIAKGAEYNQILGFAYVLFALSTVLVCSLRSVELVKISVIANIASFLTNAALNYLLIFGNFGFPKLGIQGAAIATLIARIIEFIIVITYVFFIDKRVNMKFRYIFRSDKVLFRDLLRHGTPVVINEIMWSLGITIQAAVLGHITYSAGDPVAANSIAGVVQQISTVFIFGVANAAAVMVGKAIGEGRKGDAMRITNSFKLIANILGILAFAVIFLLKDAVVDFYNVNEATKQLASEMLVVIAFVTFFVSTSATFIVGILRGAGDTKFCLLAEMLALWGVSVPLALILGLWLQIPVPFVLLGMKLDEIIKTIMCYVRTHRIKFIKVVTREKIE